MERIIGNENASSSFIGKFFKVEERGSTIRTEVIGGITTFLTMAYIIFVNPAILSATGMDKGALITVTCLATAIGTAIAAFWANAPFALAPGMGLNAFFTYTLVLGQGVPWEDALGVVFLSGLFFLIMTLGGIREKIANAIPSTISTAATSGIGLFIAFIGLKNMGLIVSNPATLVGLGGFSLPTVLGILGLAIMAVCEIKKINGGILISIAITTILGMVFGIVEAPSEIISLPPSIAPIFMKLNIFGALKISLMGSIFSFMFIDLFDSLGFMMACYKNMGLSQGEEGAKGLKRMLQVDVSSTLIGSILGTSTVTSFAESAAGIAAGARTGLASLVTSILFIVALLFTPLVGVVPGYASAPALVLVGVFMFKSIGKIDFSDMKMAVPAFVTIVMMPLTYSISIGLSFGFLAYIITHIAAGEVKKINFALWAIGTLSFINLII
ncbi:NCS2 family permease [Cetobacterium sp. SF1]|uniref:NCS2 family permease n=1 Tax=unclassified Cetobacterium TaxID=2630983 RepID=UPI003CFA759D